MKRSYVLIIILIFLGAPILNRCSGGGYDTARVTIDLGLEREALKAQAPSDINSIILIVTGPDMKQIQKEIDKASGTIAIDVPAGSGREFLVDASTPATAPASFRGLETADLEAGASVSLPINMAAIYRAEGSIDSPILISSSGGSYTGRVSRGRSYYYTTTTYQFVFISVTGLTDDADVMCYGNNQFTGSPVSSSNYGRTKSEYCNTNNLTAVYIMVDGSYTGSDSPGEGAAYKIEIFSNNGGEVTAPFDVGSISFPIEIAINESTGFMDYVQDGGGTSYYAASITPGITYWPKISAPFSLGLFQNEFSTPVANPFVLNSDRIYITVTGGNNITEIELVTNEGSQSDPIYLFPGKINYCQVGAGSSYYIFEVTPGKNCTVTSYSMNDDVDFSVFDDAAFSVLKGTGTPVDTYKEFSFTPSSGFITVRVDDVTGGGSAFQLEAQ